MGLVIKHNLHLLSPQELAQYLRDVSEYVGIDPDLNAFDTLWMPNEFGNGSNLVIYARRGTAEILRNLKGIEIDSLTHEIVRGSIVFTAKGHDKTGRHEIATGSKHIEGLSPKAIDDAIMTASTRALRRLTMQFTTLGILDESEVTAAIASVAPSNPAAAAKLINPLVIPDLPTVLPNNAPGKVVTPEPVPPVIPNTPATSAIPNTPATSAIPNTPAISVIPTPPAISITPTPVESTPPEPESAPASKRRRKRNEVALDIEPEPVLQQPQQSVPQQPLSPEPSQSDPLSDMPTEAQLAEYRKKISVYTSQLPASEGMGSVQKMRAFITHMSGTTPQSMTVSQWNKMISWFEDFVAQNSINGLVKYINDVLGVK